MVGIRSWRGVTRAGNRKAARNISAVCAPVICLGAKVNSALLVTVRNRLVERAPLLLAASPLIHLSTFRYVARRVLTLLRWNVLISPIPAFLRFEDGTDL